MKLFRVQSMFTLTHMYPMYKDRHIQKLKNVMRHINVICMNRRLFWMHLKGGEVVQGAVHEHHDPHIQGLAHGEFQEGHKAH
jgi:hypothetical protein